MSRERKRSGGRGRLREARSGGPVKQPPFKQLRNPNPPYRLVSDDQVEAIHRASLKVLKETGMRVTGARALDLYREIGAEVDAETELVRFDPALVEEMISDMPGSFTIHARNPERSLEAGGDAINFASVCGPSFVSDLDRGRRAGTYEDTCNFVKIVQGLNIFHHEGGAGLEPLDLPPESRHLDMMYAQITLSDKGWHPCWLNSRERARDCIEMAKIALGVDEETLSARPAFVAGINTNSPLLLDESMSDGIIEMARAGQPNDMTPFTLAGAMSPATLAGSLVQQNAEALACFVLAQAARRGAPVIYGHFTSNVDMRTGSPAFGTPEYAKSLIVSAQLARRYGVPFRSSNTTASPVVDAQAAYESEMSCWSAVLSHTNIVRHGGGWLEGGLVCSFEKLILDAEMLQLLAAFLEPLDLGLAEMGLEAIDEVGPGGHFFGAAHTLERYETAFYQPLISDWRNFEAWKEDGAKTATQRANTLWKKLLADYEKPPIDPGVEEELQAYMAKRKAEIAKTGV